MSKNNIENEISPNNEEIMPENKENEKPNKGTIYEEMQIYDTSCNKIRTARNFSIRSFEERDKQGKVCMIKSVEFYIVGNNNSWKMFIPFDDFVKANPHIKIPGAK